MIVGSQRLYGVIGVPEICVFKRAAGVDPVGLLLGLLTVRFGRPCWFRGRGKRSSPAVSQGLWARGLVCGGYVAVFLLAIHSEIDSLVLLLVSSEFRLCAYVCRWCGDVLVVRRLAMPHRPDATQARLKKVYSRQPPEVSSARVVEVYNLQPAVQSTLGEPIPFTRYETCTLTFSCNWESTQTLSTCRRDSFISNTVERRFD